MNIIAKGDEMTKKNIRSIVKIPKGQLRELRQLLNHGIVYELGQPYHTGMPHYPMHPAFLFSLTRKHGDYMYGGGVSAAADMFTMGGHVGTHLDSLGHIYVAGSCTGRGTGQDYVVMKLVEGTLVSLNSNLFLISILLFFVSVVLVICFIGKL